MNFLKLLLDYVKTQWTLAQTLDRNAQDLKKLRAEHEELTDAMKDFVHEVKLALNDERHEREKLVLQLENELLRFERRLPPKND